MQISDWASIATVVAGAASVCSLVAVAYQIRSLARQTYEAARLTAASTEAIRSSTYVEVLKTQIEQDRFLAEHPRFRRYIYGRIRGFGWQRAKHSAQATAEMFVDMVDLAVVLRNHLPTPMAALWEQYIVEMMQNSAYIRTFWQQNRTWYDTPVQEIFDKCLTEAERRRLTIQKAKNGI